MEVAPGAFASQLVQCLAGHIEDLGDRRIDVLGIGDQTRSDCDFVLENIPDRGGGDLARFLPLPPREPQSPPSEKPAIMLSTPAPKGNHSHRPDQKIKHPFLPLPPGEPRRSEQEFIHGQLSTPAPRGTTSDV